MHHAMRVNTAETRCKEDRRSHQGGLIEAMGRAPGAVSIQDVRGYFAHCDYRTPAHQL